MLRVGLTGGLGSGKSTVAALLRGLGAAVIEADELGRTLMEPGHTVYDEIVRVFGPEVVAADGRLNRSKLAELAFAGGRLAELNAIVHPAVIRAQREWMDAVFAKDAKAVAVVESALIFEVERDAREQGDSELSDWRNRLDRLIVVTAPDAAKIERYVNRVCAGKEDPCREAAAADARRRMAKQIPDAEKAARADFVIANSEGWAELEARVAAVWERLKQEAASGFASGSPNPGSLE